MPVLRGLHLHLEPVSGIAGDMTVAALVDAGVPPSVVTDAVAAVGVRGLRVRFETRRRGAFMGRGFVVEEPGSAKRRVAAKVASKAKAKAKAKAENARVHAHSHAHPHGHDDAHHREHAHRHDEGHPHDHEHRAPPVVRTAGTDGGHAGAHRDYAQIRRLIARAKLDPDAQALAQEIFARLARVEAALHGTSVDRVTFHEVGAFDSIADIVGMSAAIAWLAPVSIGSLPPVVGTGTVFTAHGMVPVPAPATAQLLRGIPMIFEGPGELTTPTGAALLATVVDTFGPPPPMRLVAIGYGAGTRIIPDRANVLRVMLGQPIGRSLPPAPTDVLVLETNIDDLSGQLLVALFDALFAAGALDVWSTSIQMKKGRPAQQVSALVEPTRVQSVERAFFLHSTTLGLRVLPIARVTLARTMETVRTPHGPVRIKVAGLDGEPIGAQPEYDDCRRLAAAAGVPVRRVWTAAVAAAAALTVTAPARPKPARLASARPAARRARRRPAVKAGR